MLRLVSGNGNGSRNRKPAYSLVLVLFCAAFCLSACGSDQPATAPVTTTLAATATRPVATPTPTLIISPSVTTAPTKPAPPSDWQYRWLKGIPCKPPCWEGITPGQTTPAEAVEILKRSPIVSTANLEPDPLNTKYGYLVWNWIGNVTGSKGYDGEAKYYAQDPTKPVYIIRPKFGISFKLGDIIQAYGEPSHVIATAYPNPDIGSGLTYSVKIIYLSQGFAFDKGIVTKDESYKPIINGELYLLGPDFFAPDLDGFGAAFRGLQPQPKLLVPWEGFKSFDFYCRIPAEKGVEDCSKMPKAAP